MRRQHCAIVAVSMLAVGMAAREQASMQQKLQRAAADFDGVLGIAAKNLLTGEEIVWNADTRFPTASTIKTAVMIEAYHQAAEGKLSLASEYP